MRGGCHEAHPDHPERNQKRMAHAIPRCLVHALCVCQKICGHQCESQRTRRRERREHGERNLAESSCHHAPIDTSCAPQVPQQANFGHRATSCGTTEQVRDTSSFRTLRGIGSKNAQTSTEHDAQQLAQQIGAIACNLRAQHQKATELVFGVIRLIQACHPVLAHPIA